jgi:hypothetical protein
VGADGSPKFGFDAFACEPSFPHREESNDSGKVRTSDRWRVVHSVDGTAHVEGETLTVPADV